MRSQHHIIYSLAIFAVAVVGVIGLTVFVSAQGPAQRGLGLPDDWSHRHVVFTNPGTAAEALAQGRLEQWYRIVNEPRYQIQQMKRSVLQRQLAAAPDFAARMALLRPPDADRPPWASPIREESVKRDWSMDLGGQATAGAGQYPAKYSFGTTSASCSDYVVYNTGVSGSSSQATVVAYTNLYATTCGSTVPTIAWAYNTGGIAALSPVLSGDGTQVAFIQTVSSVASLVVLRMANSGGTATTPATITSVANSAYPGCTAACYTTISLGANDTNSPPFYDYLNDVMYVGDDSGNLHKLAYVFNGTSTNYLTSSWSTNVSSKDGTKYGSSGALSGPTLDPVTGLIFVGDRYGYLHSVNSTGGSLLTSGQLGNVTAGGPGINDAPLIDTEGSTSNVYVFLQNTNSSKYTYINEFPTGTSISGSYGTAVGFSGVNGTQLLYDGAFDNQWYTSGGTSGNLYVCGVDSTNNAYPTLFQVALPLTAGTNPTSVHTYAALAGAAAGCSPPTEFYNGTTDYLFLSVTGSGTANGCAGPCMYSFILPNNTTTHSGTASAGLSVAGGSSGIVIDNSGSGTGESQIYFTTLSSQSCAGNGTTGSGTGGCAVQASQSGLD